MTKVLSRHDMPDGNNEYVLLVTENEMDAILPALASAYALYYTLGKGSQLKQILGELQTQLLEAMDDPEKADTNYQPLSDAPQEKVKCCDCEKEFVRPVKDRQWRIRCVSCYHKFKMRGENENAETSEGTDAIVRFMENK